MLASCSWCWLRCSRCPRPALRRPPGAAAGAVGGANSEVDLRRTSLSRRGLNCSTAILGSPTRRSWCRASRRTAGSPVMPKVGDPYWTAFLVSIPGNPCGSGSSSVVTTLVLPPHTNVDSSRPIRCFGLPRSHDAKRPGRTSPARAGASWARAGPTAPPSRASRPTTRAASSSASGRLANGQLFWIFVPVKRTAPLVGAGDQPAHGFRWLTDATGVYANPGLSTVWANVFPAGGPIAHRSTSHAIPRSSRSGTTPRRTGQKNTARMVREHLQRGHDRQLVLRAYAAPSSRGDQIDQTCGALGGLWNGAIPNTTVCPLPCCVDLWQVEGGGPNKGFTPFYYDDDDDLHDQVDLHPQRRRRRPQRRRPRSRPSTGRTSTATESAQTTTAARTTRARWRTAACPACRTIPTRTASTAPPTSARARTARAPSTAARAGSSPTCRSRLDRPSRPTSLVATLLTKQGAVFKRASLAKGAPVKFECTVDSAATGALSITKKVAAKLGIKTKKKTVGIASGKGQCKAAGGGSLKLKLARAYAKKVKKAQEALPRLARRQADRSRSDARHGQARRQGPLARAGRAWPRRPTRCGSTRFAGQERVVFLKPLVTDPRDRGRRVHVLRRPGRPAGVRARRGPLRRTAPSGS